MTQAMIQVSQGARQEDPEEEQLNKRRNKKEKVS